MPSLLRGPYALCGVRCILATVTRLPLGRKRPDSLGNPTNAMRSAQYNRASLRDCHSREIARLALARRSHLAGPECNGAERRACS